MPDFVTDSQPFEAPIGAADQGYAQTPPSLGRAFSALFGESSTIEQLSRVAEQGQFAGSSPMARALYETATTDELGQPLDPSAPGAGSVRTPMLSADEANKQYAPEGTKITDQPIPEGVAKLVGRAKAQEIDRESVISRFSNAHSFPVTFGTGIAAFLMDPLNLATTFLPGIGEETALAGLGRVGLETTGLVARTGARLAAGAASGVVAQAPVSLLRYGLGQLEASDYDLRSAFYDMMMGAAGGAVMHAGFGALKDLLRTPRGAPLAGEGEPAAPEMPSAEERVPAPPDEEAAPIEPPAPSVPLFDPRAAALLSEEAGLRQRDAALREFLGNLEIPKGAEEAQTTLARLGEVERQLGAEGLTADERRALERRRDELLTDTNPEILRETAAALEMRRQAEAQRASIAARLGEIATERQRLAAEARLTPPPWLAEEAHSVAGADAITKAEAMRAAVSQIVDGRPVDVRPVTESAPRRVPLVDVENGDVAGAVAKLVAAAKEPRGPSVALRFGKVEPGVVARARALGVDIDGFDHVMQTDEVRHVLKGQGQRVAAGQLPITAEDLGRVPEIVATADEVRLGRTDRGLPALDFIKREGGTTSVVEEVRNRRGQLAFKTMHRYPEEGGDPGGMNAPPGRPGGPSILRPEPTPGDAESNIGAAAMFGNEPQSPAEIAASQRVLYRKGFASGIPQGELDALNARIYGEGAGLSEPLPEAPKGEVQTTSGEGGKINMGGEAATGGEGDPELAEAEAQLRAAQERGEALHPEDQAELDRTAEAMKDADRHEAALRQAAECLGGGGA